MFFPYLFFFFNTSSEKFKEKHYRHPYKERSLLSSTTTTTHDEVHAVKAQKSIIEGNTVSLQGGKDISLTGSSAASTKETALSAGRNISINAAEETDKETYEKDRFSQRRQSVFFYRIRRIRDKSFLQKMGFIVL